MTEPAGLHEVALPLPFRPPRRLAGIGIAVVEDHALLAQSLRLSLGVEGADVYVVGLSGPARIVEACMAHGADVILLDLELGDPAIDGELLIAPLVAAGMRVIVLTGCTDRARLGGCLLAGATGIIDKAEDLESLVEQLRLAVSGQRVMPAQLRSDLIRENRSRAQARHRRLAPFEALTERERHVLAALVHGHQVDQICRDLYVSEATARTHVRGILRKLDVRSQLAAVALARDVGWEPAADAPS